MSQIYVQNLENIWKLYLNQDYQNALHVCAETLVSAAGIDLLHIAGLSLMNLHKQEEGMALLKAAIAFKPQSPHIYVNSAYIAEQTGRLDDVDLFTTIGLIEFPDNQDLLLLKANNLVTKLKIEESEIIYKKLYETNPNNVQTLVNLGNIARYRENFEEAEQFFIKAEKADPTFRDIRFARATMYTQQGFHDKAMNVLTPLEETDIDAQFLLALLYLGIGNYEKGLKLFRSRGKAIWYRCGQFMHPLKPFDHWTEAKEKKIAVVQEGGLGDLLQFMRYIPELAKICNLTIFSQPTLTRIIKYNLPENITIRNDLTMDDGDYDYVTTDVEMPYHFRTIKETIPNKIPYLFVDPLILQQKLLPKTDKKRVGLCWAGGARDNLNQRSYDDRRSITLKSLLPLSEIKEIEFVSLQLGEPAKQNDFDMLRPLNDSCDMMDTAAIIEQLDLIITVDTSVVHLAGAMGKPTWLLSRFDCCWRWHHNEPQSIWYPNVKVFGQKTYRDWSIPLEELKENLKEWVIK